MSTIGTAGHVDHGKSSLIQALTGINPDRLREEQERGMTIDLGFAWLELPSGTEISIVDVPGHERFIKNMLAGVGGIDAALLVIAADEGVMPQTREHADILDLLGITRGVVALTKVDLVEPEWLELVTEDVEAWLKTTSLANAKIIPASSYTGAGLPELLRELDRLVAEAPSKRNLGRPRLPVDRVFTISGFGTVVTGTLSDGRLNLGQEIAILPGNIRSRVRGLQTHKHKVDVAIPGSRVAVNVAGVATEDIERGDVLTLPGLHEPTQTVDVKLKVVNSLPNPLQHNTEVSFHTGSAEVMGRLVLLEADELAPGATGWAQIRLSRPVVVTRGDPFVVRSPNATVGGGIVVAPHPQRHRRYQPDTITQLALLERGTPEELLLAALEDRLPVEWNAAVSRSNLGQQAALAALKPLLEGDQAVSLTAANSLEPKSSDLYLATGSWNTLVSSLLAILREYHRHYPLRSSMAREELRSRLGLSSRAFNAIIARLLSDRVVNETGAGIRLAEHQVQFTPDQERRIAAALAALHAQPYSPPAPGELGLDPELLAALLDQGTLVRLNDSVVLPAEIYQEMIERVKQHIQTNGSITVAEVRDIFNTSRKYALALLEHMDEARLTRRVGDERVLR